jgi:hypothetical protein
MGRMGDMRGDRFGCEGEMWSTQPARNVDIASTAEVAAVVYCAMDMAPLHKVVAQSVVSSTILAGAARIVYCSLTEAPNISVMSA